MANNTDNDGKVLGMDSEVWSCLFYFALLVLMPAASLSHVDLLLQIACSLFLATIVGWILAGIRGRQAEKEQEVQKEIQKLLSSPNPPPNLTADPALYKRAQAELQTRKEEALKMQQLHALRQQVEEEERKAGIFAPTLSPTRPQSGSQSPQNDPVAAAMAQLAQRKIEAERQKHLMKSLRAVEDAEWEADDV